MDYEKMWNELKAQIYNVFEPDDTYFLEDIAYADVLGKIEQLEKENEG